MDLMALKNLLKNLKRPYKYLGQWKSIFDAIIYDIIIHKSNGQVIDQNKIVKVRGKEFCNDFLDIKEKIELDRTLFGYYDRFFVVNEVFSKHNFFIKFFERRDMFRFLIKKNVIGKKEVTRKLSSSVTKKFNGYENIKRKLACKEKVGFTPLDIVYEPT